MQKKDREGNPRQATSSGSCSSSELSIDKKDKRKEEASEAEGLPEVDDMPPLIDREEDSLLEALRAYYLSQNTFRQGLFDRVESIAKSYINVNILTIKWQINPFN